MVIWTAQFEPPPKYKIFRVVTLKNTKKAKALISHNFKQKRMIMETVEIWHVEEEEGGAEYSTWTRSSKELAIIIIIRYHHWVSSHEMTTWRTHKL